MLSKQWPTILLILFTAHTAALAQLSLDLEGNYIFSISYNDVRIPATGGTLVDIGNELDPETTFTYRIRLNYTLGQRHVISALAAPLEIKSSGTLNRNITYDEALFRSAVPIQTTYRFNSYRITYRYLFVKNEKLIFGAGLTAKVREANIIFENRETRASYPDLGFVPLVNFYLQWMPTARFNFLVEGDALATSQGRAEDVFAGILFRATPTLGIKGGYRLLEGGADVTDNYNFSWINYAAFGVLLTF